MPAAPRPAAPRPAAPAFEGLERTAVDAVADAPPEQVPGLELTRLEDGAAPVQAQALAELEVTRHGDAGALPHAAPLAELEATSVADPLDWDSPAVAPVPELERTQLEDPTPRSAPQAGAAPCRYCQHVQADGLFCEGCGMRLSRVSPAGAAARAPAASADGDAWGHCPACRTKLRVGRKCRECGVAAVA
jgi:hypothetical protein